MKKKLFYLMVFSFLAFIIYCVFISGPVAVKSTKAGQYIAVSEDILDNAILFEKHGDKEAFFSLADRGLILPLKPDTEVYVLKYSFPGKIEIMGMVSNVRYWARSGSVE